MTKKADQPITDAMIDETLDESFPASDPPNWTLGHEPHVEQRGLAAEVLLALLSPEELEQLESAQSQAKLAENEEYVDLSRPERGVLIGAAEHSPDMAHLLPKSALRAETWSKVRQLVDKAPA